MFDTKRSHGLALSAVSALAITGLTWVPSQAVAAPDEAVTMISQLGGKASVRPDGNDDPTQYVDLVAERRDPDARISFEVNADPAAGDTAAGWTAIDGETYAPGNFFTVAWEASAYVGDTVSLRAVATTEGGATYSTVNGVSVTGSPEEGGSAAHSISVHGSHEGYFKQPYASTNRTATQLIVDGSASALDGTVDLSWWKSSDGAFSGTTTAPLTLGEGKIMGDDGGPLPYPVGDFQQALDITGYDADANDRMLALRGVRDSDDVALIDTYAQTIGSAWASAEDDTRRRAKVGVVVDDLQGEDVAGAEVRRLSDGALVGYTDGDGLVIAEQDAGTTESYYVNTTDTDAYEDGTDVITNEVVLPAFESAIRGVEPVLADGHYFDDDEYEAGDVAMQLVDQEGDAVRFAGQELSYSLWEKGAPVPEPTTLVTDADGSAAIPFDPSGPDVTYVLDYSRGDTIEFTSGDSTLTLSAADDTATSGGQITYTGSLSLDGHPLAGRSVDLTYTRGTEAAPGTVADAGIIFGDARVLTTTVTTDEDGTFTTTVSDPAEADRPAETGGTLTATAIAAKETASATATFTAGAPDPVAPAPPAVKPPATVKLKLNGSSKGRSADKLTVRSTKAAAGQRVRIFAKAGKGRWKVVATTRLDRSGRLTVKIKDRNGKKLTSYRVQSTATPALRSSRSNVKRLR